MSKVLAIIVSVIALGLSIVALVSGYGPISATLQGASGQFETFAVAGTKNATSSAITSVPVATSTDPLVSEITLPAYADRYDLDLCVVASSTATVVNWNIGYSEDGTTFYGEDNSSTTAQVVSHSNSTTTNSWLPATTNRVCKRVEMNGQATNHVRINFSRGTAFSNYMIYSELSAKKIN